LSAANILVCRERACLPRTDNQTHRNVCTPKIIVRERTRMAILSMNQTTTFRWSFEEDAANYSEAGIPALGVWRRKLSDCGQADATKLLQSLGLKVSHLFWAGGFTGSDGRNFRESIEDAREALLAAAELGTDTLTIFSGARAGHTLNHARRLFKDALKTLAPQAAELGVFLAVEPMHPGCADNWTFINTIDSVLDIIHAVDSPHVKIVLDTYHLGFSPALADRIAELAPHISIVQLGDAWHPPAGEQNRCRLGEGIIPLGEIIAALKAAGYNGYYDVELLGADMESAEYTSLLDHAKDAFAVLVG
jgi:sugar phosphate isomerase/epimerase